jgi:hypothetical protein
MLARDSLPLAMVSLLLLLLLLLASAAVADAGLGTAGMACFVVCVRLLCGRREGREGNEARGRKVMVMMMCICLISLQLFLPLPQDKNRADTRHYGLFVFGCGVLVRWSCLGGLACGCPSEEKEYRASHFERRASGYFRLGGTVIRSHNMSRT